MSRTIYNTSMRLLVLGLSKCIDGKSVGSKGEPSSEIITSAANLSLSEGTFACRDIAGDCRARW
jgi:hypothetical protein